MTTMRRNSTRTRSRPTVRCADTTPGHIRSPDFFPARACVVVVRHAAFPLHFRTLAPGGGLGKHWAENAVEMGTCGCAGWYTEPDCSLLREEINRCPGI